MSDIMYNDIKYDLNEYVVHDDQQIKGFFGPYRWLSNFEPCIIEHEDLVYPSTENAYQAAKIVPEQRHVFLGMKASQSKRMWQNYKRLYTDEQWTEVKNDVMYKVLSEKFSSKNPDLRSKLLETGEKYLEETNHWKDVWFGVYYKTGEGQNYLGKLLMQVRSEIKAE